MRARFRAESAAYTIDSAMIVNAAEDRMRRVMFMESQRQQIRDDIGELLIAAKDTLKQAFADAKVPAGIEVYPTTQHGRCRAGSSDPPCSERRRL
jgi:hypothetical protein